jgi:hypothetical protein
MCELAFRVKSYQAVSLARMYKHYVKAPKCNVIRKITAFLWLRTHNLGLQIIFSPVIAEETQFFFEIYSGCLWRPKSYGMLRRVDW